MTIQRIVSGAHYGLRDWLAQRVTGVIMALYTIFLLCSICTLPQLDYYAWSHLFSGQFMKVATMVVVLSLIYHAWVGIRDVYMDYLKNALVRLLLEVGTIVLLAGYAIWAAFILWRA
ncbi:MAG: succinate dehydrogenase, hydrophobic membrane anchor protein [Lautropia sp.]|nr:succinate dehydrogenase, hydrophobic membrane anchor protein [Lautropia sp.]